MLSVDDLEKIKSIVEHAIEYAIEEKTDEIKEMIRHEHNDVENLKRELTVHDFRLNSFAGFVMSGFGSDKIDQVENPDRKELKLDELYSPVDKTDEAKWEEHLKKEKDNTAGFHSVPKFEM